MEKIVNTRFTYQEPLPSNDCVVVPVSNRTTCAVSLTRFENSSMAQLRFGYGRDKNAEFNLRRGDVEVLLSILQAAYADWPEDR